MLEIIGNKDSYIFLLINRFQLFVDRDAAFNSLLRCGIYDQSCSEFQANPELFFSDILCHVVYLSYGHKSVCPSVRRPSDRCVYCDENGIIVCQYLNTIHSDISSLSIPTGVAGNCPLPSEIFAESDPPLRKTPTSTDFRL